MPYPLNPLDERTVVHRTICNAQHDPKEGSMVGLEFDARISEVSTEQGSTRSLVAIEERMIGYDAEGISACLLDSTWIQVCTAKGLKRLR